VDVVKILSRLGVAKLQQLLGAARTETLDALGLPISASTLSEALVLERGKNLFKDKMLRADVLRTVDQTKLLAIYNVNEANDSAVEEIANFSWGNNKKSNLFLTALGIESSSFFEEEISVGEEVRQEVPANFPLHVYQDWVRRQITKHLIKDTDRRAIVHMPTGAGKTRVSMEALADYIRSLEVPDGCVVWLAHSEELCEQACESFRDVWARLGTSEAHVVRLWGGQSSELVAGKPNFVVTSFQTAYRMIGAKNDKRFAKFAEIKKRCILLIIDEAHQTIAPTYQSAIELISNQGTQILGLTATPGRDGVGQVTGGNRALADFYDNKKITIVDHDGATLENPIRYLQEMGVLSSYKVRFIEGSDQVSLSDSEVKAVSQMLDIPQSVLNSLGKDHARATRVAAATLDIAINRNLQTIVFCPTKDNAVDLALFLKFNDCKAAAITGETPSADRARYISDYKSNKLKVLTNFGVLTAGFDAPNTEAVIIARPTVSVVLFSQMVGRGLRGPLMGGTPDCLVVDVKDNILNLPNIDEAFSYYDDFFGRG